MKLSRSIACAFAFALITGAAMPSLTLAAPKAEKPKGPAVRAIAMLEEAAQHDSVKLDETQKTKIHEIVEDAMAQAKALQQDAKAARGAEPAGEKKKEGNKEARAAMAELTTQTKDRVEAVLSDSQKPAFRAALKQLREAAKTEREAKRAESEKKPA